MKKIYATFIVLIGSYMFINYDAVTHSDEPLPGKSGAPGQSDCTQCHSGIVNSGSGSIEFTFPTSMWSPDSIYDFEVFVNDTNMQQFGFQMTALNESNDKSGNFTIVNNSNTTLQNSGGKQYISHLNANANSTWNFKWTAPIYSPNDTIVNFYIAANAANNNGSPSGDKIYKSSLEVNRIFIEDTTSNSTLASNKNLHTIKLNIFPNPSQHLLHLVDKESKISKASIYTLDGKYIKSIIFTTTTDLKTINIENINKGQYVLKVYSNYKEYGKTTFIKL